jgi:hypothetical protein
LEKVGKFLEELPGGIFSNKKSNFGKILASLVLEDVGLHSLCPFGT